MTNIAEQPSKKSPGSRQPLILGGILLFLLLNVAVGFGIWSGYFTGPKTIEMQTEPAPVLEALPEPNPEVALQEAIIAGRPLITKLDIERGILKIEGNSGHNAQIILVINNKDFIKITPNQNGSFKFATVAKKSLKPGKYDISLRGISADGKKTIMAEETLHITILSPAEIAADAKSTGATIKKK